MIEVRELTKRYGEKLAVDGLSFEAPAGRIFGLLGPNGAGKSTAIGCLSGLLRPSDGTVRVAGLDIVRRPREAKRRLGVVPQELALYEDLPARENLRFWGAAQGLGGARLASRVEEVLDYIGLGDRATDLPRDFSGGMKRRLNFGCGLVHEPAVLLLDEPTVGVDPQSRERLFEMVVEQAARGACVLYTTHYMEEAERLCDELVIVDEGRLVARGTLDALRAELGERDVLELHGDFPPETTSRAFGSMQHGPLAGLEILHDAPDTLTLALADASHHLSGVFAALAGVGAEIRETRLRQPNLETLFLKLTGRALRR